MPPLAAEGGGTAALVKSKAECGRFETLARQSLRLSVDPVTGLKAERDCNRWATAYITRHIPLPDGEHYTVEPYDFRDVDGYGGYVAAEADRVSGARRDVLRAARMIDGASVGAWLPERPRLAKRCGSHGQWQGNDNDNDRRCLDVANRAGALLERGERRALSTETSQVLAVIPVLKKALRELKKVISVRRRGAA